MSTPKRLYFDIETSPCEGWFWRPGYNQNVSYDQITKQAAIICICYKWEGEKKVRYLTWDHKQSDRKMLIEFIRVAKDADEMVGHNGDKFDLAWIRTRCLFHSIDMFPSYRTIDTLKISRSKFKFPSNRLNDIARYLDIGQKIKTDTQLWKDVCFNNLPSALDKMVRYCKKDVILLETIWNRLSTHVESKVHHGVLNGGERGSCPQCGALGNDLVKQRVVTTATGLIRVRYKCNPCGKYHTKAASRVQKTEYV